MPHKMMNSQIADVLHDNRLSIEARMLYAYLCSFDDGAPPSTCQIIRQLGIGKTRFYRYRNELEAFGLIEVENTITSGGGVAKYSFPDEPVPTAEAEFQDGTALLFQPGNAQPFCVATDYDRATASWSYGKYFSDLGCAHEAADPEIIEDASVRWVKEDIREKLKAQDIAPTEFNVQSVIMGDSRLWERPLDRDFRDNMIASGNDDLDARVAILKENGNFKNVDTAMPVESLDDLEQYRSDRLTDKVTSLKDSLDAQYKADERGRVFDRPCQVLDDGDLDEH